MSQNESEHHHLVFHPLCLQLPSPRPQPSSQLWPANSLSPWFPRLLQGPVPLPRPYPLPRSFPLTPCPLLRLLLPSGRRSAPLGPPQWIPLLAPPSHQYSTS